MSLFKRRPFVVQRVTCLFLSLLLVMAGAACGGRPQRLASPMTYTSPRDVLLGSAIPNNFDTAFEAIQRLRPEFLLPRVQPTRVMTAIVYVDGARLAGLEMLKLVPRWSIVEIRYVSGGPAAARFGVDHLGGAILIKTSSGFPR